MARLKYTLGFVYCKDTDEILLLNRQKKPWMGRWNGVGGKLDKGESPLQCIVRETREETGLELPQYEARGVLLWDGAGTSSSEAASSIGNDDSGGSYLFTAEVSESFRNSYKTPLSSTCGEGVLDWKKMSWIMSPDNLGLSNNLKFMLPALLTSSEHDSYVSTYDNHEVKTFEFRVGANTRFTF